MKYTLTFLLVLALVGFSMAVKDESDDTSRQESEIGEEESADDQDTSGQDQSDASAGDNGPTGLINKMTAPMEKMVETGINDFKNMMDMSMDALNMFGKKDKEEESDDD